MLCTLIPALCADEIGACRAEGYAAYYGGGDTTWQPYPKGSLKALWWREGYTEADDEPYVER